MAPGGTVYVAEMGCIQHFSATGAFLGTWGSWGCTDGQFTVPKDVAVAADGTVYVADSYNYRVQAFGTTYPTTWRGEYHDNRWLTGAPVLIRNDPVINFNWGAGSPGTSVPSDDFSARWYRHVWFEGDWYRFTVFADDGVRLWVDRHLLIERWQDGAATDTALVYLSQGHHQVQLEYYEDTGDAAV